MCIRDRLKTASAAAAVVEQVRSAGSANIALLYDAYHLAANGDDVFAAIDEHFELFCHCLLYTSRCV